MNTPADIYSYAYQYIFLIFLGISTTFLYNLISGAIRALGDSRAPVVFLVISSAVNIVLDLVFILAAHMGVAGAALATVISQLFSGLLSVLYLVRRIELLHIRRDEWTFQPHLAKILLIMGVPMGLQYSIHRHWLCHPPDRRQRPWLRLRRGTDRGWKSQYLLLHTIRCPWIHHGHLGRTERRRRTS